MAYLYAWDGSKATGPALYASAVQHFTGTVAGLPEEEKFVTGNLLLTSGQQYVAFLSTSELPGQPNGSAGLPASGAFTSQPYAGGDFVACNNTLRARHRRIVAAA